MSKITSPTLHDLQSHLMELNAYLRRRDAVEKEEVRLYKSRLEKEAESKRIKILIQKYEELIFYFEDVLQPFFSEVRLVGFSDNISLELQRSFETVSSFLDFAGGLGYDKRLISKYLGVETIEDFVRVSREIKDWRCKMPASGMGDWEPLDEKGVALPPWRLNQVSAFESLSVGIRVHFDSEIGEIQYGKAVSLLEEMNAYGFCSLNNWTIPDSVALKSIDLNALDIAGFKVPKCCWVEGGRSTTQGLRRAFDWSTESSIVTGGNDAFHFIFVARRRGFDV